MQRTKEEKTCFVPQNSPFVARCLLLILDSFHPGEKKINQLSVIWITLVDIYECYEIVVLRYLLKQRELLPLPYCIGSVHRYF